MRLLFIADGRSPIALNWMRYFLQGDHEVHLVSTFLAAPEEGLSSFRFIPVAFSSLKPKPDAGLQPGSGLRIAVQARTSIRQWLGPLTVKAAAAALVDVIDDLKPDLIHAMRIPYEGMIAADAARSASASTRNRQKSFSPLIISVWGNDFTLHAASTPLMNYFTRKTMQQASALHTDCLRDQRLAHGWGFIRGKPMLAVPGGGGVQQDIFYPSEQTAADPVIINPRGFRAYVNNEAFFKAAFLVHKELPDARFLCPGMQNEAQAQHWINNLGISAQCELLPQQSRSQMAALFRSSRLTVSPSNHDGTPNTLLEAMACGCLPVVGDLESIREWITHGENGLLVNPNDPQDLAQAMLRALLDDDLVKNARAVNSRLIAERAEYSEVMRQVQTFYQSLIS